MSKLLEAAERSGISDYTVAELAQLSYVNTGRNHGSDNLNRRIHPLLDRLQKPLGAAGRGLLALGSFFGAQQIVTPIASADSYQFQLGFKTLADQVPKVGQPLENEMHNPQNGDGLQHTTGGLLVWRKVDNWTAFTDGYNTWVNGPTGLQQRLNTQRYPWEANPSNLPLVDAYQGGKKSPPENVNTPFPREIGNPAGTTILRNQGTSIGIADGNDPSNNWQTITDIARRFGGGDRFEIYTYDDPNQVPTGPQYFSPETNWLGRYPGKQLTVHAPGLWQWHVSLPTNLTDRDLNQANRDFVLSLLLFFVIKDKPNVTWGPDFKEVLRQQLRDTYNNGNGPMNFSVKVVVNR